MRDRQEIKTWLQGILARTGETPTGLARRAGIAQSTLTRFLASDDSPLLSSTTIAKIGHVIGEGAATNAAVVQPGFSEREAVPFHEAVENSVAAAVRALIAGRPATDPWVQRSDALALAGILPGDIMLVDLNLAPKAGNAVCAQVYDWQRNRAETLFRLYDPPYLLAGSINPMWRKPLLVDGDRVVIKGVVTHVLRPLVSDADMQMQA